MMIVALILFTFFAVISLRCIAESFIEKGEFDKAEEILGDAESWLKQFEGVTENLEMKFTYGKLYFHQGLRGQAEESLKQVLIEKLKWFGPDHVSVADVMHYLADLYAVLEAEGLSKRRLSMLTYREAFRIYQRNKEKHKEAIMLHKIGTQLNREGSLISTNEAKECLENAMDIYTTEIGPVHSDITSLQRNVKQISDNLRKGYYKFGTAKPPDKRTPEFLYSSMTWHDFELQKIGKRRKLRSAPPAYGNRSMMSSRYTFRIHTPRSLPDGRKGLLRKEDSESNSVLKKDDHHVIMKLDVVPPAQSATPHPADQDRFEDEVIVVPGGRDSRQMSARTRLAEGSEKSVSIRLPGFRRNKIPLIEEHSEWSAFSNTTTTRRFSAKISHATHRKSCRPTSGPNNLCLSVHGPHSSVISVLESTLQPRKDKKTDLVHKSAWYNVPGRYTLPGKVLPQKHNQIRPDSRLSSRRSHRSFQTV